MKIIDEAIKKGKSSLSEYESKQVLASYEIPVTREKLVDEYRKKFASPYKAAELGYIDEVILPQDTRPRLIQALMMLQNKKTSIPERRHGNVPL